jgi:hypothetical protein
VQEEWGLDGTYGWGLSCAEACFPEEGFICDRDRRPGQCSVYVQRVSSKAGLRGPQRMAKDARRAAATN